MSESREQGPSMKPLREKAEQALIEAYATDHLEDHELERRLDEVNRAQSMEELRALLSDLPQSSTSLAAPGSRASAAPSGGELTAPAERSWSVAPDHHTRPRQFLLGFWSGAIRKGVWTPARHVLGLAFQGGIELDFREACFPPGVTTVTVLAVMGGVEIMVPEGVRVECGGVGIMGAFEGIDQFGDAPDAPVLRIDGLAIMAGVEVKVVRGPRKEKWGKKGKKSQKRLPSREDD